MSERLRTFCHISEYDDHGYRQLHRLIASSDPLVLWAPSSFYLADPAISSVDPRVFLELVDNGKVRVVGREQWLTNGKSRKVHKWQGATWNNFIDEALKSMYERDLGEPEAERRVFAAPEERGREEARRVVEERPEVADEVLAALGDGQRIGEIPPGTLQTAARSRDGDRAKVEVVLRDAHNHAEAMRLSAARTAVMLGRGGGIFADRVFQSYVESGDPISGVTEGGPVAGDPAFIASELSHQLVDLLSMLEEELGGARVDLQSFVMGEGHTELIDWSAKTIDLLVGMRPDDLNHAMRKMLTYKMEEGRFVPPPIDERVMEAGGLLDTIFGSLEDPETISLLGLAFAAYSLLKAGLQSREIVPTEFTGLQWPFRYIWGGSARPSRQADLLNVLAANRPI